LVFLRAIFSLLVERAEQAKPPPTAQPSPATVTLRSSRPHMNSGVGRNRYDSDAEGIVRGDAPAATGRLLKRGIRPFSAGARGVIATII
jgi:hypothetical protein